MVKNSGADGLTGTRGPAATGAIGLLERLARRPDTRGAFGGLTIAEVCVSAFRWRILPKRELFQADATGEAATRADAVEPATPP